jgi:hypothetical protein
MDASQAVNGLAAAGGVPAAQLQVAVQQAFLPFQQQMLAAQAAAAAQAQAAQAAAAAQAQAAQAAAAAQAQAQAQALAAVLAGIQNQLAQLVALSVENKVLASRAYNAGCRDGAARPFLPVPGAGGVDAPVGQVSLQNFAQLLALSGACLLLQVE